MKKILLMLALICAVVSTNAQVAIEKSNALDNISVGVTAGVSTPLDFNSVFPLNTNVGIKLAKELTPVFGVQVEGLAFLNDNHFADMNTVVKATNVGVNGVLNLNNLFAGYNGTPRAFEIKTVTGLGWMHLWDTPNNFLTAKTGLDLAFNIGKKKAHSIVVTPAVYWNLNKFGDIHFDKRGSQLALNVSYVYHFKTSNGAHSFKTWDVGAMDSEISYLQGKLDECQNREPKVIEKVVEVPVANTRAVALSGNQWVVQFAQGSSELTSEAKEVLNSISENLVVDVVGTASPEGTKEFNQRLSEKRAAVVTDFLTKIGVKVNSWEGKGVQIGAATNRLAIITTVQ